MTETSIPRTDKPFDEENDEAAARVEEADVTDEAELTDPPAEADDADEADEADEAGAVVAETKETSDSDLFRQSEIAADYVEGLLDILDYDGDIDELVSGGRPMVEVVGGRLQPLVGQRGATLEALQELTRLAVFRETGSPSRLLLDVGGYRANRRKELAAVAKNAVEKVKEYGESVRLEPMSAFERKCVHDVVNALAGVESESEGVEPHRRIVVRPAP
ncbi:R3H domain-containing nucleic acid-binding protein [Asanoa sp. NPDC049518]|uniref:Jag family protein n=1 Tax=unclassified Asanoa TaxID=2685164 RepID=UPI0034320742